MTDDISSWLTSCANSLRAGARDAIDIEKLVESLGISIQLEQFDKRSGILAREANGKWIIVIRGKRLHDGWTTSDRFSAAHELGHYLLIRHHGYSPSFSDKSEYYRCEDICNRFAARLLVDYEKTNRLKVNSPEEGIGQVRNIARQYSVSNEVAARAIIETHTGFGICGFRKTSNAWYRQWGISSLQEIHRFNRKTIPTTSIKDEMLDWGHKALGIKCKPNKLEFASESLTLSSRHSNEADKTKISFGRIELSAVMKKPPVDV